MKKEVEEGGERKEEEEEILLPISQSNSLHLPLITSLVPHYLHLVLTPFSPAAHPLDKEPHGPGGRMKKGACDRQSVELMGPQTP
ncbi:hypothetical protein EYF80_043693 [Liparis tanakae]|uniref:Uncharacterized protein n=1 Tax=Liparis tanakae TaxID=230148 RepID=A0A4Z2FXU7_9TELE|nr:hypothetical protein EYF80_043693 [Liparis tanakae]